MRTNRNAGLSVTLNLFSMKRMQVFLRVKIKPYLKLCIMAARLLVSESNSVIFLLLLSMAFLHAISKRVLDGQKDKREYNVFSIQ